MNLPRCLSAFYTQVFLFILSFCQGRSGGSQWVLTRSAVLTVFLLLTILLCGLAQAPDSSTSSPFRVCSSANWVVTASKLEVSVGRRPAWKSYNWVPDVHPNEIKSHCLSFDAGCLQPNRPIELQSQAAALMEILLSQPVCTSNTLGTPQVQRFCLIHSTWHRPIPGWYTVSACYWMNVCLLTVNEPDYWPSGECRLESL